MYENAWVSAKTLNCLEGRAQARVTPQVRRSERSTRDLPRLAPLLPPFKADILARVRKRMFGRVAGASTIGWAAWLLAWTACAPAPRTEVKGADSRESIEEEAPGQGKGSGVKEEMGQTYENPVLPGTHPDPSICRVGDDYYLVTSSFEYFPGVPIHHSRDLVNWKQLGYVLTRKSQLLLDKTKSSHGIFAPTLRHHDGTFYMVTTDMAGRGSFYVTAKDPKGPWSDPIWVRESVFTMDPSLFFDDDGKVYYTRHGEQRHGAIFQAELDIETGKLLGEMKKIWPGTGGIWPEGPHLYKVDGTYYLMISEGGTSYDHMVTVARSAHPMGPFEAFSGNPILTHKHLPDHPIQALGHADLFQTESGAWWMVLLGIRPSTERHHHIGRETFLAPVTWNDGWPVVNNGQPLSLTMSREGLPPPTLFETEPERDEFEGDELNVAWRYVRNPIEKNYSLSARPGFLRLLGSSVTLQDVASPTLLVRPQTSLRARISTEVHSQPQKGERAGLVVRGNEDNHYEIVVEGIEPEGAGSRAVVFRSRIDGKTEEVGRRVVGDGPVTLRVLGEKDRYEFSYSEEGKESVVLGAGPTTTFAYEKTQSFTGAFVGLYAHSRGKDPLVADFAYFESAATSEAVIAP